MTENCIDKFKAIYKLLPMHLFDLTGNRYGKLLVLRLSQQRIVTPKFTRRMWDCVCDCGNHKTLSSQALRIEKQQSCGCYADFLRKSGINNRSHGNSKTAAYQVWAGIKDRCYNSADNSYKNYGGRGISVCEKWKNSFACFLEDMGQPPTGMSIERKDVNGNYAPDNCCWATPKVQCRNQRNTIYATCNGETRTLGEWHELTGIHYQTLYRRHRIGASLLDRVKRGPKPSTRNKSVIFHDGKEFSMAEFSRFTGIKLPTLYYRYKKNLPLIRNKLVPS